VWLSANENKNSSEKLIPAWNGLKIIYLLVDPLQKTLPITKKSGYTVPREAQTDKHKKKIVLAYRIVPATVGRHTISFWWIFNLICN
jgi:hypothetical protein